MSDATVYIRNANKAYNKYNKILDDFSMTVPRGTIYGLLGASGCGKTTLLSCIVGRNEINSGEIWVFGGKPGTVGSGVPGTNVGYMPQETALCSEFTVREVIFYFGRLMGMRDSVIEPRFKELNELLDLPPANRYVRECSGGQQRRVSLAVALVHSPKLLILDEPTAGVDPVLRNRIWKFLRDLTQKKETTVIITTHYIEEAREADWIGLMRGGKLLAEASPNNLMRTFETDTLEEVFLHLCHRQEKGIVNSAYINTEEKDDMNMKNLRPDGNENIAGQVLFQQMLTPKPVITGGGLDVPSALAMNKYRLKALMDKNWKQFYRNVSGWVFLLFVLPIICSSIFVFVIGTELSNLQLVVVNDESYCGNVSLENTVLPDERYNCHMENLGCRFLTYLEESPLFVRTAGKSFDEAIEGVRDGKYHVAIHLPANHSFSTEMRLFYGDHASEEALNRSTIRAYIDMSDYVIGNTMKMELLKIYRTYLNGTLKDCGYLNFIDRNMDIHFVHGSSHVRLIEDMLPGFFITFVSYMATMLTAEIIITERLEGIWDRSAVAGVTALEILSTHFTLQFFVMLIQMLELYTILFIINEVTIVGHSWLVLLMGLLQGVSGMCYGFMVSVYCYKNFFAANVMISGSFYPMVLICGAVWPIQAQPKVVEWISRLSPFTIPAESLNFIIKRGWGLSDWEVLKGFGVECVWIFILGGISIYLLKMKQ